MIDERVIVTNTASECFNQEFVVTGEHHMSAGDIWKLTDESDTIYIHKDSFQLVKDMVIKIIDGVPYLVTQQEADMIDSIIARKTKPTK